MRTTISIPNSVYEAAEEAARRLAVLRSELYTKAIVAYLEVHKDDRVTERLNEVYAQEEATIDPVLMQMQEASRSKEVW